MFSKLHFPYWAGGPIFTLMARKYKKNPIPYLVRFLFRMQKAFYAETFFLYLWHCLHLSHFLTFDTIVTKDTFVTLMGKELEKFCV